MPVISSGGSGSSAARDFFVVTGGYYQTSSSGRTPGEWYRPSFTRQIFDNVESVEPENTDKNYLSGIVLPKCKILSVTLSVLARGASISKVGIKLIAPNYSGDNSIGTSGIQICTLTHDIPAAHSGTRMYRVNQDINHNTDGGVVGVLVLADNQTTGSNTRFDWAIECQK